MSCLRQVLAHFHSKVSSLPKEPSVKDVLAVIQEGVKMFPAERLKVSLSTGAVAALPNCPAVTAYC